MAIKSHSNDNWGMGFLLVLFPDSNSPSSAAALDHSPSFANSIPKSIKRTNSSNPILTKTQSTISICVLLLFLTLLLFTLSTFEPAAPRIPRRFLPETDRRSSNRGISFFPGGFWGKNASRDSEFQFALQGMGKLYSRGTKAMSDLVVGHVVEDTSEEEFRLFFRLILRSGLTARADTVFVFDSALSAARFEPVITEESDAFRKLVQLHRDLNGTSRDSVSALRFDLTQFVKSVKPEMREPLWGRRNRPVSNVTDGGESEGESTRLSYGSVVGFEASELDPEDSLSGFLDHVPMSLKRWACYPMLLGRVRRNFKHVMLVDVKKSVVLSDPFGRVRGRNPESVHISTITTSSKHARKNSEKTQLNPAILMGGTRGIRRLSNAMLTEIVRAAMQHKKKGAVTESGILSQLVGNGHLMKNIELASSAESIPEPSSLSGLNRHKVVQRDNTNSDLNSVIMKHICSLEVDSLVYRDCLS